MDFNHLNICWRDNTTGHKQSRRLLQSIHGEFLSQVIEEPSRRGSLLDLILTNKKELVGDGEVKDILEES